MDKLRLKVHITIIDHSDFYAANVLSYDVSALETFSKIFKREAKFQKRSLQTPSLVQRFIRSRIEINFSFLQRRRDVLTDW